MKAAELIKNEPFADLLTATVSSFLKLRFGGEWRVSWTRKPRKEAEQLWIVNLNINAVFCRGVNPGALENIKREFATSAIPWKRPFQRLYFWLAATGAERLFAHAFLNVEPAIPDAPQWLMIPGTHKIRFVNATERIVYCHLKKGSRLDHFRAENIARKFAADKSLPVPPILEQLSNDCIVEKMIEGTPLNRLTSSKDRDAGLKCALDAMDILYRSTARQIHVEDYVAHLISRISEIAQSRGMIATEGAEPLVRRICKSSSLAGFTVEIVRSHGDFQPGNILYDKGAIWLIDWEYSVDRQRQYDRLTYLLKARFLHGLGARIIAYADSVTRLSKMRELRLFLVESIVFQLEVVAAASYHSSSRTLISSFMEFELALPAVLRNCEA